MDTSKSLTVAYIDHMGDDKMVVNAARASFNKVDEGPINGKDIGLLNFLARGYTDSEWYNIAQDLKAESDLDEIMNIMWQLRTKATHFAPFCHPQLSVRITAPLAIARQMWKSHIGVVGGDVGYAAWSEESRRYVDAIPEFFIPKTMRKRAHNVKQGSSTEHNQDAQTTLEEAYLVSEVHYKKLLDQGVAPELARLALSNGMMVTWVWTGSLMFIARVFSLRADAHAQVESQQLAAQINDMLLELFPVSFTALKTGDAQLPDWWVNKATGNLYKLRSKFDDAIYKLLHWGV
jgi:thymidylate synthase (FAD)